GRGFDTLILRSQHHLCVLSASSLRPLCVLSASSLRPLCVLSASSALSAVISPLPALCDYFALASSLRLFRTWQLSAVTPRPLAQGMHAGRVHTTYHST